MLCQAHNPLVPGSNPGGPTSKALCTWGFPSRRFRAGDSRGHASFGSREKQPKRRVGPWLASWRRSASGSGSARSPSLTGSGENARAAAPRSRVVGLALRAKTPAESPKAPTRFDARGDEPRQTEFDLQGQDFVRIPGATFRLARPRVDRAPEPVARLGLVARRPSAALPAARRRGSKVFLTALTDAFGDPHPSRKTRLGTDDDCAGALHRMGHRLTAE